MSADAGQTLAALRLYFPVASKASARRFWHRLLAPQLAQYLLSVAKKSHIKVATLHHVTSGYLPGKRLSHHHPELTNMTHPQCLELLDSEENLRAFLQENTEELKKVYAVLLKCEEPHTHSVSNHTPQSA
ncbi:TPA: DUF190 domain-containing protein [Klebsiella aerogenes]|nr:DUF190 domain-containing protein [Klebsiella aerogenes]